MTNLDVPSPRTFGVQEYETAGYLNSVRDALNFLLGRPQIAIYQATVQSVASNAFTAITFDGSTSDTYGGHSNTTNNSRYTAQQPGTYAFSGATGWAANATGSRGGSLYKNGSPLTGQTGLVQAATSAAASTVAPLPLCFVDLNTGDYVELYGYQVSGGALNTIGGGQFCSYLNGWWMHS